MKQLGRLGVDIFCGLVWLQEHAVAFNNITKFAVYIFPRIDAVYVNVNVIRYLRAACHF